MDDDAVIGGHTTTVGGVPILNIPTALKELQCGALAFSAVSGELQHRRLGHASDVIRNGTAHAYDLEIIKEKVEYYEPCRLGKAKRLVSHDPLPKALKAAQIIYIDVQHITPRGFNGYNYLTAFLDDKTRMPNVRFHATEGGASDKCIKYCTEFQYRTGNWPTLVAKDQGREFFKFIKWAKDSETSTQFRESPARTPQPNGPIEWL